MRFLFDAHQLGKQQTGNETWVRNVVRAMEQIKGDDEVHYVVAATGFEELRRISTGPAHGAADNSVRRLVYDVPRIARQTVSDAVFATYTAPLTSTPVVLMVHDASSWHAGAAEWLPLLTRLQYRISVGMSARRVARVLTPSATARDDVVKKLRVPDDRVFVAPNAVDAGLDRLLRETPPPPRSGVFTVLAVGNVLPRKNLIVLGEAVRACRDVGVPAQLRIVGAVPGRGQADAMALRDRLGPHVQMTGYVTLQELAAEYKGADVLGFPSFLEGFGVPVIEAMAAGIPVVVSDTSALPEVAGGAALVCGAQDIAAWRDALLRLYEDAALRHQLRQRGRARVGDFSWRRTAEIVLEQLHAAAASRPRRTSVR